LVTSRTEESYEDFHGENFTLGLLWNATPKWNLGMRYDSAFEGDLDYQGFSYRTQSRFGALPFSATVAPSRNERRRLGLPGSIAVGAAYRANDRFTIAADITRTEWDEFYLKTASGRKISLVNAGNLDDLIAAPRFDPTYSVRLGCEYLFLPGAENEFEKLSQLWSLRAGVFYEQEPASGRDASTLSPFNRGIGEPEDFYGVTAGVGLLAWQRVNVDAAYQLRYGGRVNRDLIRGISGLNEDVFQHRVLVSLVIYF
jgi:long-subunit fatty acid transport protein